MSRLVRIFWIGGLVGSFVIATPVAAQGPTSPVKIGYVNARLVLQGMPGYSQAESLFVAERDAAQNELDRLRAGFDSSVTAFEGQQSILSPSSRAAKRQELAQRQKALEDRAQQLSDQVSRKEQELLNPMQQRLTAVIDGLRAEGNFAIIFDVGLLAGAVISADPSLDITQRVVERLRQSN